MQPYPQVLQRLPVPKDSNRAHHDPDVIILSSDDDQPAPSKRPKRPLGRQRSKAKEIVIFPEGEVLEITSEDEQQQPQKSSGTTVAELQRKVARLEKENSQIKREKARSDRRVAQLQADCTQYQSELSELTRKDISKPVLDISQFEDYVTCEICSLKLWEPYILPACGHTFCRSCLTDWFNTTLVQHLTAHPHYRPIPHLPTNMNQLPITVQQQVLLQRHMHRQQHPAPIYTCPTCREEVTVRPAEVFALKAIVRSVAGAMGETSPRKPSGNVRGVNGGGREGLWGGFFPGEVGH